MLESARVMVKVFIDGKVRETMGATLTTDENVVRLQFDRLIHVEDGESLRIEEVPNGH